MARVVIFGLGDFAQIARVYLERDSPHEVVAFAADREHVHAAELGGLPVVPSDELELRYPPGEFALYVAIGFSGVNKPRAAVYDACKARGYELVTYVSSRATLVGDVQLGDNVFIFEENVVQPFVTIGSDVVLWSGNHVGHHSRIDDHVFIASHAVISGNVTIGHHCFVGVNATLRDGITVAPECVIGAGALIMKDTERGDVFSPRGTPPRENLRSWDLRL